MPRMAVNTASNATGADLSMLREGNQTDLLTIVAIAIAATVITDFIHEGLGHGGVCVATGGQSLVLCRFFNSYCAQLFISGYDLKHEIETARLPFARA